MKEAVQYNEVATKNRRSNKKHAIAVDDSGASTPRTDLVNDGDSPSIDAHISTIKPFEMKPIEQLDPAEKIAVLNAFSKLLEFKIGSKATKDKFVSQWLNESFSGWVKDQISKIFNSNSETSTFTKEEVETLKTLVVNIKQRASQPKPKAEAKPASPFKPNPNATPLKESVDTKGLQDANHALLRELAKMDRLYDPDA